MDAGVPGQAECVYNLWWFSGCTEKGWSQWMQMFQVKFSMCTINDCSLVVTKKDEASGCRCSRQAECVYSL